MSEQRPRPLEILLVDDNPADVRLTREALGDGRLSHSLSVARDGEEALDYLRREGATRPDVVLLDLNLPRKDGREVLAELRADAELHSLPVVVLTASQAEEDVLRSYDLRADGYLTKPVGLDRFAGVLDRLLGFAASSAPVGP